MKRDVNAVTIVLFLLGIASLVLLGLHPDLRHVLYIAGFVAVGVLFFFIPVVLPSNIRYSLDEIGTVYLLVRFGFYTAFETLFAASFLSAVFFYARSKRKLNLYRVLTTTGMYYVALIGSWGTVQEFSRAGSVVMVSASVLVFSLVNVTLLSCIQLSLKNGFRVRDALSYLVMVLVAVPVVSVLTIQLLAAGVPRSFAEEAAYAFSMLLVIILLSRAYAFAKSRRIETERRYRLIAEHASDLILLLDDAQRIRYASPSHEWKLGRAPDRYAGRPVLEFIHPDDRLVFMDAANRATEQKTVSVFEVRYAGAGDSWLYTEMQSSPVTEKERLVGLLLVARDVTERKQAEELLRRTDRLAAVGQLAAGVAHEIRNPLTALKGFLQLLVPQMDGQDYYLEIMRRELESIQSIIDEFLLLAKPQPTALRKVQLDGLLAHVCSLMEAQAVLTNVRIERFSESELPGVYCEEGQIRQVFVNIVKNAIEAMPGGGLVSIRTSVAKDRGGVTISVRDAGPGIPEERLHRLGEPFYTTKERGTGLGLMVCFNIIQNHQGTLTLNSRKGEGTEVVITLPVRPGADSLAGVDDREAAVREAAAASRDRD